MSDNIIEFGALRLKRERRKQSQGEGDCRHWNMTLDDDGEIVTCDDCGKQLGAYWALRLITEQYQRAWQRVNAAREAHAASTAKHLVLNAAQKVEKAWRSRSMVPSCPHCHEAIFPEDGFGGAMTNREIALRRRKSRAE